ncbi:MAG: DUF4097 family beta strand repeat-containing protein [Acidobacteria bacterium]|nr:DUF4097 family beta strand repeat-containing protein [Acidobacteriota bacterium]
MARLLAFVLVCAAFPFLTGCDLAIRSTLLFGERRPADELFEWQGRIAAGQHVEIKGVSGTITAAPSTSGFVEVTADRRGARNDPNEVRIAMVEHPAGVTVCAVYPREGNECLPGDEGRLSARRNDVNVEFTVGVPAGVDFVARHVNGNIGASGLTGDVEARTVNGSIDVTAGGHARAVTVNGAIKAAIAGDDWDGEGFLETVNGSVTLTLPETADADVSVRTANGSIRSDLPITDTDERRQRFEGRLGNGGGTLRVRTVNGSVRLQSAE